MQTTSARGEICIGASELDAIEVIEFCLIFESSEDKVTDIVVLNRASLLDYVGRSLHDIGRTFNCYIDFSL